MDSLNERQYRNIHSDSVRQVDQILVNALNNEAREILDGIRSGQAGEEWVNDGVIRPVIDDPNAAHYPGIERRFNYGVDCDDRDELRLRGIVDFMERWNVFK